MENYNTDFDCTYHLFTDEEESDLCYRMQYLEIFNLKEFNNDVINNTIDKLENNYSDNKYILKLIAKKSDKEKQIISIVGESANFRMCFQYDKLFITHYILSKLINNEIIDEDKVNNMINGLKL